MKTLTLLLLFSTSVFADGYSVIDTSYSELHIVKWLRVANWSSADTKREAIFLGLRTFTFLQTYTVAKSGWQGHYEQNKLLGKYPHQDRVTAYFVAHSLVHFGVSYILPPDWRHGFQYVTIGEVGAAAYSNHANGVRISFPLN